MTSTTPEYLTIAEAAGLLRVSVSTIRRWIRDGGLPAHRVGKRRLVVNRDHLTAPLLSSEAGLNAMSRHPRSPRIQSTDRFPHRHLTDDERTQGLAAMERATTLTNEVKARQVASGIMSPESWELINEGRDERTRQLMGEIDPEFDDFDIGPIAGMIVHSPDRPVRRLLTADEQHRMMAALARARRTSARIQERSGIDFFPPSWPLIAEMRDERTRQLAGDDDLTENFEP